MALNLRSFRVIRGIVWSALLYAEQHQGQVEGVPGMMTLRLIRALHTLVEAIDVQIAQLSEFAEMGDLAWRRDFLSNFGLDDELRAELEALRQWLIDSTPRLEATGAHHALVLADNGRWIIGRALSGEATRTEVVHHIADSREAIAAREAEGRASPEYRAVVHHWLEVWERLAEALAEVPA